MERGLDAPRRGFAQFAGARREPPAAPSVGLRSPPLGLR